MTKLLGAVSDLSDAADEKRKKDLERVQRARQEMETKLRRLPDLVAEGLMSLRDKVLAERLAEYKQSIASFAQSETSLRRSLTSSSSRITEDTVRRFGLLLGQRLSENTPMRKAYVRLLVGSVVVNDNEVVIKGSKAALEAAGAAGDKAGTTVPRFDREWCPTDNESRYSDHWKITLTRP